jgi:hypothetical protein
MKALLQKTELWVRFAAIAFVLVLFATRWDATTGLTSPMRFGENFAERRLPELKPLPLATARGDGYDGQFYAQIAVQPKVTDPALVVALDKPSYRPRRILMPVLAHVVGAGDPWIVLQVYALLNPLAWIWLAVVFWRLMPIGNWKATAAWLGVMLGTGTLDSINLALTDLPAALLVALAAEAVERGKALRGALWFLAAGLVREVSVVSALLVRATPATERWRTFWLRAACTGPVIAWCAWLAWRLPGPVGHEGNINWPGFALMRQFWLNGQAIAAGDWNPLRIFGVLGAPALAAQSVFVLRSWREFGVNPWVAAGVPFAVLFWLIGADPWIDYRAVARDVLPMTFVFNLLWVRQVSAHPLWLLANVSVIDGIQRMTWL